MSILIKNVEIIDGEGRTPYKSDVFIEKNIISAIGNFKDKEADEVIDGLGNYLAPGFIDIDTASDHYLGIFTYPEQSDFVNQGVSTILGGHCGSSLAPLLYGTLES
ncbi:MAG TPA: D-aminoacylase, partial [Candidatus Paceibacterota bacterium]